MINKGHMFVSVGSLACFLAACSGGQPSSDGSEQSSESVLASQLSPSDADMIADFRGAIQDASASQGAGAPTLWCMADEDTTIRLFGTVHLLLPELDWRTDAINRALALSDTIVFETDTSSPEAQPYIAAQYQQRGMFNDGRRLRDVLSNEDEAGYWIGRQILTGYVEQAADEALAIRELLHLEDPIGALETSGLADRLRVEPNFEESWND